jgi:ketosteroid isomerase-like protein
LKGAADVRKHVFERIGADWTVFGVNVEKLVVSADGASIAAIGRYTGKHGKTGRDLDAPFVHTWSTKAGRLTRFETFTDTLAIHQVMGR